MRISTLCLLATMTAGLFLQGCHSENLDGYQVLEETSLEQPQQSSGNEATPPDHNTVQSAVKTFGTTEQTNDKVTPASAVTAETPETTANQPATVMSPPGTGTESELDRPVEFSPAAPGTTPQTVTTNDASTTTTPSADASPASATLPDKSAGESASAELKQEIKLLVPNKIFIPEGDALRVTFDDLDLLKVLNMEKVPLNAVDYMPDWLKGLDGKKVTLRGWMYPPASQEGIRRFIFVRDNGVCCFGPKAKIYDKVAVTLREGTETSIIQGHAFDVTGTFTVEADVLDDELMFLYFLDDCVITDK